MQHCHHLFPHKLHSCCCSNSLIKIPNIHPNPFTHNLTIPPQQHCKELLFSTHRFPSLRFGGFKFPQLSLPILLFNMSTLHQSSETWLKLHQHLTTTCNSHHSPTNTSWFLLSQRNFCLKHHLPKNPLHIWTNSWPTCSNHHQANHTQITNTITPRTTNHTKVTVFLIIIIIRNNFIEETISQSLVFRG